MLSRYLFNIHNNNNNNNHNGAISIKIFLQSRIYLNEFLTCQEILMCRKSYTSQNIHICKSVFL